MDFLRYSSILYDPPSVLTVTHHFFEFVLPGMYPVHETLLNEEVSLDEDHLGDPLHIGLCLDHVPALDERHGQHFLVQASRVVNDLLDDDLLLVRDPAGNVWQVQD